MVTNCGFLLKNKSLICERGLKRRKTLTGCEQKFSVRFGNHRLQGDCLTVDNMPVKLIMLHGGGLGTRDRYAGFRAELAKRSIGSLAFDFVGFGETGGSIGESSLQNRTEQTLAVLDALAIKPPYCLMGTSMGAYTAVKLSQLLPVESLMLFVPAMYDRAAYQAPFGEPFTQIIRRPESWVNSDAWEILAAFRGKLLMVTAGRDAVIPPDVIRRIEASASQVSEKRLYTVTGSPHLLVHYLSQNKDELERVIELVQQICKIG
jgi:pimeloyl-ACP methyl ester carboxylesterase